MFFRQNLAFLLVCCSCVPFSPVCGQQTAAPQSQQGTDVQNTWTQWRGPERTSLVSSPILAGLGELKSAVPVWNLSLQPGYCGPIVTTDKVFVAETVNKKYEVVRALDRKTGNELWKTEWEGSMEVPFFAKANGDWIRSTPVWDNGRLFVGGMRDVLVCLNDADGSELWRIDFVEKFGARLPDFGMASSPLVHQDHLYVQAGNGVVKIESATGKVIWKSLDGENNMMSGGAFSSPVVATLCGQEQLLVQTRLKLCGVSLENGSVLWSQEVPTFRGMNILTPVAIGDQVFTSTYQGGSFLFDIARSGDSWSCTEVWHNGIQAYMSSPVVIDGYIYMHLRNQRFICLDWKTGEEKWKTEKYGQYWSMVASGDKILALDEKGKLLLIRATPEKYDLLEERKVSDESAWAHVALAADEVFVRDLKGITAWRLPSTNQEPKKTE